MISSIEKLRDAILCQSPTDEQKDAIFSDELEFLLRASPGSGKTWTSSRRFIWRGANRPNSSGGLALLSFTNAAIREFQESTATLGRADLLSAPNYVGTFDAFVERFILTPFGHLIASTKCRPKLFIAPRPGDRANTNLKIWTNGNRGNAIPTMAWDIVPYPEDKKVKFKTTRGQKVANGNAVNALMSLGFYTHEQRAYWGCYLLSKRPHIAKVIAKRFPEIIVDEAQDTNTWLLLLLNFLRENGTKITLIGDPDQCIFEFNMADATSLPSLKKDWGIPEKPLSKSFRCNDRIAAAVKTIGGNAALSGRGDRDKDYHRAYIVRESSNKFSDSIRNFQSVLGSAQLDSSSTAIVCRARDQLESVRGEVNFSSLQGKTKALAKAAFIRDIRFDYKAAYQQVETTLREITPTDNDIWNELDENPESDVSKSVRLVIWRYVKSPTGLPSITMDGSDWIQAVRQSLSSLIQEIGIRGDIKLGNLITKRGLEDSQMNLPLFCEQSEFPALKHDTIHQVKGESIDAVLVVAGTRFWNSVTKAVDNGKSTEDRRLAYVAMSRARHLLVVALPCAHFDKQQNKWKKWGFEVLEHVTS